MFDFLNLPKQSIIDEKIDKKMFYDNSDLNSSEKRWFREDIERITWCNRIAYDTVNIKGFCDDVVDYTEIQVINVNVKTTTHIRGISNVIFSSFPYPLILIFSFQGKIAIFVASVRINQNDKSRLTIEETIQTKWISNSEQMLQSLSIRDMGAANLFVLYSSFIESLMNFKIMLETDSNVNFDIEKSTEYIQLLKEMDAKITSYKSQLKNEDHFNRLVAINDEIKKLEMEREKLINKIKGE